MVAYAYPNRTRAHAVLLIYHDAMRPYVAETLKVAYGAQWFEKYLLGPLRKRAGNGDRHAKRALDTKTAVLAQGKEHYLLLDDADISVLVKDHRESFQRLRNRDIDLVQQIRRSRNEDLVHDLDGGDCEPEVAGAITNHCILVLKRCGLDEAAENIRRLSQEVTDAPVTTPPEQPSKPSSTGEQNFCLCGCGQKTKSTFKLGHEGRLERIIRSGSDEERASVDWQSVPLTFENGDFADEIRKYRNDDEESQRRPERVPVLQGAPQISAGEFHSVALRADGSIACWGTDDPDLLTAPLGTFTNVSAGTGHSVALRKNGVIVCWGRKHDNQLNAPKGKFRAVSAGAGYSVALRKRGAIACWGRGDDGQLNMPKGKFIAVSAGLKHSVALREDGTIAAWGNDQYDRCDAPEGKFVAVSAGGWHNIGLREDGTIICWGASSLDQCEAPAGRFVAVSAGHAHSVGLREDGTIVCWGDNKRDQCKAPSGRFLAIDAGMNHNIALREDGTIVCWGDNSLGQCDAPEGNFLP